MTGMEGLQGVKVGGNVFANGGVGAATCFDGEDAFGWKGGVTG